MASTKKTVVVQLDRFNRKIELDCSGKENETDALMKKVRTVYSDKIGPNDGVTLQAKDEDFHMFIDYYSDKIEDKSCFNTCVCVCVCVCVCACVCVCGVTGVWFTNNINIYNSSFLTDTT